MEQFFKKIDIISDVIISIAAVLEKKFLLLSLTLQSLVVPNFMSPLPPWGMIKQKHPGADRVKTRIPPYIF